MKNEAEHQNGIINNIVYQLRAANGVDSHLKQLFIPHLSSLLSLQIVND